MTIVEKVTQIFEDEKKTKVVQVKSWEISGTSLPHRKNNPVRLHLSGCPILYMNCSHQDGDVFLAFPISFWQFVKLKWHHLWHSS